MAAILPSSILFKSKILRDLSHLMLIYRIKKPENRLRFFQLYRGKFSFSNYFQRQLIRKRVNNTKKEGKKRTFFLYRKQRKISTNF